MLIWEAIKVDAPENVLLGKLLIALYCQSRMPSSQEGMCKKCQKPEMSAKIHSRPTNKYQI